MQLEILTPERKIFTGKVLGIQLPGIEGSFEILERHAPMVTALGKGKMKIIKSKSDNEIYNIDGGFVETLQNRTVVLIEGAESISY